MQKIAFMIEVFSLPQYCVVKRNEIDKMIKNSHFIELKLQSGNSRNNFLVISNTLAAGYISAVQIFAIS